jgi:hypothetical protein
MRSSNVEARFGFVLLLILMRIHRSNADTQIEILLDNIRLDNIKTYTSYFHSPSKFEQFKPVQNPNGLFLLTVDEIGSALLSPITLSYGQMPKVLIDIQNVSQSEELPNSNCTISSTQPTPECQWGYLSGAKDKPTSSMPKSIDSYESPFYTKTYDPNCKKPTEKKGRLVKKQLQNLPSPSEQQGIAIRPFTITPQFEKSSGPTAWLKQPVPTEPARNSIAVESITAPTEQLESLPVPRPSRLKNKLLKIVLFRQLYLVIYGAKQVIRLKRWLMKILREALMIPSWMLSYMKLITLLLKGQFVYGRLNRTFSAIRKSSKNLKIKKFPFWYVL